MALDPVGLRVSESRIEARSYDKGPESCNASRTVLAVDTAGRSRDGWANVVKKRNVGLCERSGKQIVALSEMSESLRRGLATPACPFEVARLNQEGFIDIF